MRADQVERTHWQDHWQDCSVIAPGFEARTLRSMNTVPSPDPAGPPPTILRPPGTPHRTTSTGPGPRRRARPVERAVVENPDPLLSVQDLSTLFSVAPETARRIARTPGFPSVYVLTTRALRWRRSEVEEWVESRRKQSRTFASDIPDWLLEGRRTGPRRATPTGGAA